MRCERDNRDALDASRVFVVPNGYSGLNTTHNWHANIHEYDVVAVLLHGKHGLFAVVHDIHVMALVLKDFARELLVHQVVLGKQDVVRNLVVAAARCRRTALQ